MKKEPTELMLEPIAHLNAYYLFLQRVAVATPAKHADRKDAVAAAKEMGKLVLKMKEVGDCLWRIKRKQERRKMIGNGKSRRRRAKNKLKSSI